MFSSLQEITRIKVNNIRYSFLSMFIFLFFFDKLFQKKSTWRVTKYSWLEQYFCSIFGEMSEENVTGSAEFYGRDHKETSDNWVSQFFLVFSLNFQNITGFKINITKIAYMYANILQLLNFLLNTLYKCDMLYMDWLLLILSFVPLSHVINKIHNLAKNCTF
jgi:hypothetical protein